MCLNNVTGIGNVFIYLSDRLWFDANIIMIQSRLGDEICFYLMAAIDK